MVHDRAIDRQGRGAGAGDAAGSIAQRSGAQRQRAIAAQCPLIVVEDARDFQAQTVFGVDAATAGVGQLADVQLHALLSGDGTCALVVNAVGVEQQRTIGQ